MSSAAAPSAATSALRHAIVTMSSEPMFDSNAHPDPVVEVALFVPAGFPADAPGGAGPVQARERNAPRVRHLDDARRDGLRFLAEADDERDAAALAVFMRGAQQVAEVRIVDVGDLRGVERIAEAQPVEIFLDAGGERVDVRVRVARVAEAEAEAPGVRQAPARFGRDAPAAAGLPASGETSAGDAVGPVVVQPVGIAERAAARRACRSAPRDAGRRRDAATRRGGGRGRSRRPSTDRRPPERSS